MDYNKVLNFWFPTPGYQKFWFNGKHGGDIDIKIKEQFYDYVKAALSNSLYLWEKDFDGILALIILLDQMTRNIARIDTNMKDIIENATAKAITLAKIYLLNVDSIKPKTEHLVFILMPFRHSSHESDKKYVREYVQKYEHITDKDTWERFTKATLRYT